MINLKISIEIDDCKQFEFEQAIKEMLQSSINNKSQSPAKISRDLHNPNLYFYTKDWSTKEIMEKYIKSDDFHELLGAMKVLGKIIDAKYLSSAKEEKLDLDTNI